MVSFRLDILFLGKQVYVVAVTALGAVLKVLPQNVQFVAPVSEVKPGFIEIFVDYRNLVFFRHCVSLRRHALPTRR